VLVLGVLVLVASAAASALAAASPGEGQTTPAVRLRLPSRALRAGQSVQVTIVNPSARPLMISDCFLVQLREPDGWKTVTRTHGVQVPCPLSVGFPLNAQRLDRSSLILYDDLRPGTYRITMGYKILPEHWRTANFRHHRLVSAELRVLRFRPGPPPHISARRIRRIALKAAAGGHPTLIQHAEGTRFMANVLAGGDLVWDWHWAYLIAIKGRFKLTPGGGGLPYAADPHPSPPGYQPQHYSVITLVLDARTGRAEDFGASHDYPDIAKLGPVTTDLRR
jgi:hypothetical protein